MKKMRAYRFAYRFDYKQSKEMGGQLAVASNPKPLSKNDCEMGENMEWNGNMEWKYGFC